MERPQKIAKLKARSAKRKDAKAQQLDKFEQALTGVIEKLEAKFADGLTISNIDELLDSFSQIGSLKTAVEDLRQAIADFPALPGELKVEKLDGLVAVIKQLAEQERSVNVAPPEVKVDLSEYLKAIKQLSLAFIKLDKSVTNAAYTPSQEAKDYLPYRRVIKLGQGFVFDDIQTSLGGGSRTGVPTAISTEHSNLTTVPVSRDDGSPIGGLQAGTDFDYLDAQQTSATQDTYVFKTGGAGGSIVRTIDLVFTDSTKADLDSVTWS